MFTLSSSRSKRYEDLEFDIELRVRKTLTFSGPTTEEAARSVIVMALSGQMDPSHFIKWSDGHSAYRLSRSNPSSTTIHKSSPFGRSCHDPSLAGRSSIHGADACLLAVRGTGLAGRTHTLTPTNA